jgi:hypothetical protein
MARGEFRDPRLAEIKIGDWYRRSAAHAVATPTAAKLESLWRTHCEREWAAWPMGAVTRMEAQEWVKRLTATRRARHKGRDTEEGDKDVPALSAGQRCRAPDVLAVRRRDGRHASAGDREPVRPAGTARRRAARDRVPRA